MGMLTAVTPQLPIWGMIAVWAYFAYWLYWLFASARREERRRREEGQPHTKRDTMLLLLSGLCVVGVMFGCFYLNLFGSSRLGGAAVLVVVAGGLTYIFNRKAPRNHDS